MQAERGQVWVDGYDYQISDPKEQGFVQPSLQIHRVDKHFAFGVRYPSNRRTRVRLAPDGSVPGYQYLGEMRPAPEWRKALVDGVRVIAEREDNGESVFGGSVAIVDDKARVAIDFPESLAMVEPLNPADWFAFERYWLMDPKTGECAWVKLTCAIP